jgi:hypothetical protein
MFLTFRAQRRIQRRRAVFSFFHVMFIVRQYIGRLVNVEGAVGMCTED